MGAALSIVGVLSSLIIIPWILLASMAWAKKREKQKKNRVVTGLVFYGVYMSLSVIILYPLVGPCFDKQRQESRQHMIDFWTGR